MDGLLGISGHMFGRDIKGIHWLLFAIRFRFCLFPFTLAGWAESAKVEADMGWWLVATFSWLSHSSFLACSLY
jgi:hypothetical protein